MLLIITHPSRFLRIRLKYIYLSFISYYIIITGYLSFILSLTEGFIGHLLRRGQMPYRGITAMINIIAVIPIVGIIISELI